MFSKGLFTILFCLESILVNYIFLRTYPFTFSKVIHTIFMIFNIYIICSDVPFFISDIVCTVSCLFIFSQNKISQLFLFYICLWFNWFRFCSLSFSLLFLFMSFLSYYNKLPQILWLKTLFSHPEVSVVSNRDVHRTVTLLEALGENFFPFLVSSSF